MERDIFRRGSTTYYWASKFFPKAVRDDVFRLYSFLRVIDDLVDQNPSDKIEFYRLKKEWETGSSDERVIANILSLQREGKVKTGWVKSFFDSMELDLKNKKYEKLEDTLVYAAGSAEVVGLMMASIMKLPKEAEETAKLQGRAMQWINFVRDVQEDNELGRLYFPSEDLGRFKLKDLSQEAAQSQPEDFTKFIHFQIARYKMWQRQAEAGYRYIPRRLRIPVKTAAEMYSWTAEQIAKDPMVVYRRKIKPSKKRALFKILTNVV